MKNTFLNMKLENGEKIELTLNFARLLQLKNKNKAIYEKYNKILCNGAKDAIEDTITVIYVAYLCANVDKEELLGFNEFAGLIPQNFGEINNVCQELISPKKKKDLENHSEKQQEK